MKISITRQGHPIGDVEAELEEEVMAPNDHQLTLVTSSAHKEMASKIRVEDIVKEEDKDRGFRVRRIQTNDRITFRLFVGNNSPIPYE